MRAKCTKRPSIYSEIKKKKKKKKKNQKIDCSEVTSLIYHWVRLRKSEWFSFHKCWRTGRDTEIVFMGRRNSNYALQHLTWWELVFFFFIL